MKRRITRWLKHGGRRGRISWAVKGTARDVLDSSRGGQCGWLLFGRIRTMYTVEVSSTFNITAMTIHGRRRHSFSRDTCVCRVTAGERRARRREKGRNDYKHRST